MDPGAESPGGLSARLARMMPVSLAGVVKARGRAEGVPEPAWKSVSNGDLSVSCGVAEKGARMRA